MSCLPADTWYRQYLLEFTAVRVQVHMLDVHPGVPPVQVTDCKNFVISIFYTFVFFT